MSVALVERNFLGVTLEKYCTFTLLRLFGSKDCTILEKTEIAIFSALRNDMNKYSPDNLNSAIEASAAILTISLNPTSCN